MGCMHKEPHDLRQELCPGSSNEWEKAEGTWGEHEGGKKVGLQWSMPSMEPRHIWQRSKNKEEFADNLRYKEKVKIQAKE